MKAKYILNMRLFFDKGGRIIHSNGFTEDNEDRAGG